MWPQFTFETAPTPWYTCSQFFKLLARQIFPCLLENLTNLFVNVFSLLVLCLFVFCLFFSFQKRRSNRQVKRKKYAEELEARLSDEEVKVIVKAKKANTAASKEPALQLFVVSIYCMCKIVIYLRSQILIHTLKKRDILLHSRIR